MPEESEIEIRQVFEPDDFGPGLTPELREQEVSISVLGSRARWFESVPERSHAKDPAPLKVKEVWVKERRYIVCLE